MNDTCHPIFVTSNEQRGYLYTVRCPECGRDGVKMQQVSVAQNGVATLVDRRNDRVADRDTSRLPGALVELACRCGVGHRFTLGFLHGTAGTRVYAGKEAGPNPDGDLWINRDV